MLLSVEAIKPNWCLFENVTGFINLELDTLLAKMESFGYSTGQTVIPASAVNSPQKRSRLFIIAWNNFSISNRKRGCRGNGKRKNAIHVSKSSGNSVIGERDVVPYLDREINGLPEKLDGNFNAWGKGWEENTPRTEVAKKGRSSRLQLIGNSVCPQVIEVLALAILNVEKGLRND
tara:strand:- start:1070 stop:1597 length:528 start_codon:yes stop_codon:yes gene_type:complete